MILNEYIHIPHAIQEVIFKENNSIMHNSEK